MWITAFLIATIVFLLMKWIWSRKEHFSVLSSMGVLGPQPSLYNGNTSEMMEKGGLHPWMKHGRDKYGKVWGYYESVTPIMVISDVEMIKKILIENFSKFNSRKKMNMATMQDKFIHVFDAEGPRWKRLRTISAPHFTAKRMKEMSPLINSVVDNLMVLWEEHSKSGQPFNIHGEFQKLTLDVIASTAFGVDTQSIVNGDSLFLQKVRELFALSSQQKKRPLSRRIMLPILTNVPGLKFIFSKFLLKYLIRMLQWYYDMAEKIIVERKQNPSGRKDFISLMLEANALNPNVSEEQLTVNVDDEDDSSDMTASHTADKVLKGLTMEEMQAQSFLFLTAGYETTSTALAYLAYELARHPDIQQKLQEEIDDHFIDKDCNPDYTNVSKLKYMDMVVNENLRLHNIAAVATTRECLSPCQVGQYNIPKGVVVQIDSNQVMLDKDLWGPEDPNDFVPERFSPDRKRDRHVMAFLAFGAGPRNCVGMRFALMEIKIALTRLLKNHTLRTCDKTVDCLPEAKHNIKSPTEGVYVTIHKRVGY